MRLYTVHLQQHAPSPDRNAVVVSEGFCWPAFLAAPVWAAAKGMWFTALGVLSTYVVILLVAVIAALDSLSTMVLVIGAQAIIGFCANDWRRASLTSRGWRLAGLATGADRDTALRRFIDLHPDALNPSAITPTY